MKSQLFIPKKCKVGFNLRNDTYTGKLGYVIYHDGKTWRKETSWEGWRQKEGQTVYNGYTDANGKWQRGDTKLGPEINPIEFENVPTEGFVLNKKAGGYSTGWNHRSTYCRVYDPRGFEFEISIPNLLYILQECNAMRGKGLEGSFVYAWEGKDLILLPTTCEDYVKSQEFTVIKTSKLSTKELVEGCSYKDKQGVDHIYLGKFNWFQGNGTFMTVSKQFVFYTPAYKTANGYQQAESFKAVSSVASFAKRLSETPVSNYAELMDKFNATSYSGQLTEITTEDYSVPTTMEYYGGNDLPGTPVVDLGNNTYEVYEITGNRNDWRNSSYKAGISSYNFKANRVITFKNNDFTVKSITPKTGVKVTKHELENKGLKVIKFVKNNKNIQLVF